MFFEDLSDDEIRIERAKYDNFIILKIDRETATVKSPKGEYTTTLNTCTCNDFLKRHKPCKHIYRLSYMLGKYDLYENSEQAVIAYKINQINDLVTAEKMKDIFYRKRDKGDKYFIEKNTQTDFLEDIGLIKLKETEHVYSNENKKLYGVNILIIDENKEFLIDALNYRIYVQLQQRNNEYKEIKENNASTTCTQLQSEPKKMIYALLLCLFFGWLGIHRFYVRKNNSAVLMLILGLFSGFAISIIWSWIDIILIITKNFKSVDGSDLI